MIRYAVAARCYDYSADLTGYMIEIENQELPYVAILKSFMVAYKLSLPETCRMVEHEKSWEAVLFRVNAAGVMEQVPRQEIGWPWKRQSEINQKIHGLEVAIANAQAFDGLQAVPGMEQCVFSLDLTPAHKYVAELKQQLVDIEAEWQCYAATPGDGKEQRSITIKDEECKTPTTTK